MQKIRVSLSLARCKPASIQRKRKTGRGIGCRLLDASDAMDWWWCSRRHDLSEYGHKISLNNGKVRRCSWLFSVETTSVKIGRPKDRKSTRLNSSHVAISYAVF